MSIATPLLLLQLDAALPAVIPPLAIEAHGQWTSAIRKTYASTSQDGTGEGPFVEIVDTRWRGALTAAAPVTAMTFLATPRTLYWTKAPAIADTLPIDISFHAYADAVAGHGTVSATIADAYLPAVPVVETAATIQTLIVLPSRITTSRVVCLARFKSAAVFALLLPGDALKMGRKRIWRLRDNRAEALSPEIKDLLTRRRTGSIDDRSRP